VTVRTTDEILSARTNNQGRAAVRLANPGRVSVFAEAAGHTSASAEVEVGAGGGRVELTLERGGTLRGRVIGYDGQLPHLSVVAEDQKREGVVGSSLVSKTGEFRLDRLDAGTYALRMNPSGFDTGPVVVTVAPGEERVVDLVLVRTGSLEVTAELPFTDRIARPATLRLVREDGDSEVGRSFELASGIPQRIEAVPAGTYVAELTVAGASDVPTQWVTVRAEDQSRLAFTWPSGRLAGRVVSAEGNGVPAALAAFRIVGSWDGSEVRNHKPAQTAIAAADGAYEFSGLSQGRYVVAAQHTAGLAMLELDLADGEDRRFDLRLEPSRSLRARVLYAGKPVAGAMVSATSRPYQLNARSSDTDAQGVAELGHLTRGLYLVRALWLEGEEGPMRQASAEIAVEDGSGSVELRLN
jgi:hypothetical protein